MSNKEKSVTLIELLVSIILLSVVIMTLAGVDYWARSNVISSSQRSKLQNDVGFVIDHMTKSITGQNVYGGAIGNTAIAGLNPVSIAPINGYPGIRIYVDFNNTSRPDAGDRWIAYQFRGGGAPASERYQVYYYSNCPDASCTGGTAESIARNITNFTVSNPPPLPVGNTDNNVIYVSVAARWDPTQVVSNVNPSVTMSSHIKMPSVSTR